MIRTRKFFLPPSEQTLAAKIRSNAGKAMRATETRRGAWALADQGVVSIGNFVTTVLMIRSLHQAQFGMFNVAFEAMLWLNSLQASLVVYPRVRARRGG